MAGIYIHIPFCKKKCSYCNFHFSTKTNYIDDFIHALNVEISLRKDYLADQKIETLYFGGGTPSLLQIEQIKYILNTLTKTFNFHIEDLKEFTFEVNPDDMNETYLNGLKNLGINRLSIGIQSFKENDLKLMNRAHNAIEANKAINLAYSTGFNSCSVDLIYGSPDLSNEEWKNNILNAIAHKVDHISAYALTVEPKTALASAIKTNKLPPLDEVKAAEQFEILLSTLKENGYEQYEISNFSLPGKYAKHNTAYWQQKHYLGLGPSAHSYNGTSRQWNVANNALYIKSLLENNEVPFEIEHLSTEDRFNEYILTNLRTKWGCDINYIEANFKSKIKQQFIEKINNHINIGHVMQMKHTFHLTNEGKLFADAIASDLFI